MSLDKIMVIIDPTTSTADTNAIVGLPSGTRKWSGGVLGGNGKVYGIPLDAEGVLVIDPNTDTADTSTIVGLSGR